MSTSLWRTLPSPGRLEVALGQRVTADDEVAHTTVPGAVHLVPVAALLHLPPSEVAAALLVQRAETVAVGQLLAERRRLFGANRTVHSPASGVVESVSPASGQLLLREPRSRLPLRALVPGTIGALEDARAVRIDTEWERRVAAFGVGGETDGVLRSAPSLDLAPSDLDPRHEGAVLVVRRCPSLAALHAAREIGVRALVCGSARLAELRTFSEGRLDVAVTGDEALGLVLVCTEGFGRVAMPESTFDSLVAREGRRVSVRGVTQVRAGVLRPEIWLPDTGPGAMVPEREIEREDRPLELGDRVRIVRAPWTGRTGRVRELPIEPCVLPSEISARVAEVELDAPGNAAPLETVLVPRANLERF